MASNEYVNKVMFGDETLIDITDTTASAGDVFSGQVFYSKSGARTVGTSTTPVIDDTAGLGDINKLWSADKLAQVAASKAAAITAESSAKSSFTFTELAAFGDMYIMTVDVDDYSTIGVAKAVDVLPVADAATGTYWSKSTGNKVHFTGTPSKVSTLYNKVNNVLYQTPNTSIVTDDIVYIAIYKDGTITGDGTIPIKLSVYADYSDNTSVEKTFDLSKDAGLQVFNFTAAKNISTLRVYFALRASYTFDVDVYWAITVNTSFSEVSTSGTDLVYTPSDIGSNGITFIPVTASVTSSVDTKTYIDDIIASTTSYIDSNISTTRAYVDSSIPNSPAFFFPEDYGAKGDGSTNDTTAVTSCIAAAVAANGAVYGFGKYKITSTLSITADNLFIYFHKIDYTGSDVAVQLTGSYNHVEIDYLYTYSSNSAAGFRLVTSSNSGCNFNNIRIDAILAHQNAVEYINSNGATKSIYYNRFQTNRLYSKEANLIYLNGDRQISENSFWGKACYCQNGWVIYCNDGGNNYANKFYEFCFESHCLHGMYGVGQLINCRTIELMDKIRETDDTNIGILVKIPPGQMSTALTITNTYTDFIALDTTSADTFDTRKAMVTSLVENGTTYGTALFEGFPYLSRKYVISDDCQRLWDYAARTDSSIGVIKPPKGKVIAYYNHKGFVPDLPWKHIISTTPYNTITTDGYIPTHFIMDTTSSIYLDDSYCCIGINDVTIEQDTDKIATIYDKNNTQIFNGSTYGPGTYKLKCSMTPIQSMTINPSGMSSYTYTEGMLSNIYNGTNEEWTVEACLPPVTAADNGKILKVVNGVWKAVNP